MRCLRLSMTTLAAVLALTLCKSSASAETNGGFGLCYEWEGATSQHQFYLPGACYDGAHADVQYGLCNVHNGYPGFYCGQ